MKKVKQQSWVSGWWLLYGLAMVGLLVGLATPAHAADFRADDEVIIAADTVIDDDLFVSGSHVEINGTVKGDLITAASEVIVNGTVEGSVLMTGRTLTVNGRINGSLYGGGYALTLGPEAEIGRNLYFGGYSLTTDSGSDIGHSLYSGNYQTILNGGVADDVQLGTTALELNGRIGGDVQVQMGDPEQANVPPTVSDFPGSIIPINPGFRQGADASIGGELDVQETVEQQAEEITGLFGLSQAITQRIGEFIALLIVGGLLIRYLPTMLQRSGVKAQERPLPSIGYGLLAMIIFFVGVPFAAIFIFLLALFGGFVTFGQLFGVILALGWASLWLLAAAFFLLFSLVTKAVIAFWGGRFILTKVAPQMQAGGQTHFLALALGLLIYEVLRTGIGGLFAALITLIGLGAIYLMLRDGKRLALAKA